MFSSITKNSMDFASDLFKSERTSWAVKTVTDKNGNTRKVRYRTDKVEDKPKAISPKVQPAEDAELISHILGTDTVASYKAKSNLYRKYYKDVKKITESFLTSNKIRDNETLAEDLTSDAFVKIFSNLDSYAKIQNSLPFKSWLTRVATNNARDYLRSFSHKVQSSALSDEEMKVNLNAQYQQPSSIDSLVAEEKAQLIRDAVSNLPKEYSEPIVQVYFEEKEPVKVAEDLGISITALRSRLQYAKKMLRSSLNPELFKAAMLYFRTQDLLLK